MFSAVCLADSQLVFVQVFCVRRSSPCVPLSFYPSPPLSTPWKSSKCGEQMGVLGTPDSEVSYFQMWGVSGDASEGPSPNPPLWRIPTSQRLTE